MCRLRQLVFYFLIASPALIALYILLDLPRQWAMERALQGPRCVVLGPLNLHLPAAMNARIDALSTNLTGQSDCPLIQIANRIELRAADLETQSLAVLREVALSYEKTGNPNGIASAFCAKQLDYDRTENELGSFRLEPQSHLAEGWDNWYSPSALVRITCGPPVPGQTLTGRYCSWKMRLTPEVEGLGGFFLADLPPHKWDATFTDLPKALTRFDPTGVPLPYTLSPDQAQKAGCSP